MTELALILSSTGIVLSSFGTAARLDVVWMRTHGEPRANGFKSLLWGTGKALKLLWHSGTLATTRKVHLDDEDQEVGGVALRFYGGLLALVALVITLAGALVG